VNNVFTYRLVDPIGQVLLKWYQLTTLRRMQSLVIELEFFLLWRRSRHVGAIEDRNRGRSPATAITDVLGGWESIGVRHFEAASADVPAHRILSRRFSPRSPWVLFQDPLYFLRQLPGYSRTMSCRDVNLTIKYRLKSKRRLLLSQKTKSHSKNWMHIENANRKWERDDKMRHEFLLRK